MKIGNFEVGDYLVKEEGGKRHLIFDCRNCVYGASISDDLHCRFHAISLLQELEAQIIVCGEIYERVYNEVQTKMLSEIAALIPKFELENIWSYSHLGKPGAADEKDFGARHDLVLRVTKEGVVFDPIAAYLELIQEIKRAKNLIPTLESNAAESTKIYLGTLIKIKDAFDSTQLISKVREIVVKLEKLPESLELYHAFFEAEVKPSFIASRLMFERPEALELLDEYNVLKSNVQIFKHPSKAEKLYFINPPEYSLPPEKYFVLSKTKEIVASYKPGRTSLTTIAKSRKYFERVYESTIMEIAQHNNIKLDKEEVKELAEIVARYTVGYGILEILLNDRKLTDIYLDSPIGMKALYVVHSDYGQCQTNIIYTEEEASALVSKMRAMSGRPFDEMHPVLDFDLEELETRVAVIGRPLATDGTAFAFRLHKVTPWTLAQFIDVKFMNPLAAGMLSFFIDTQSTMLVTGSRGSGKTSLIGALMLEILQNIRIIVQEDSVTGDSSIVVERNNEIQQTTVGQLIDELIEKYDCINADGREVLPGNPDEIKVFSMDKNGKISLSAVSQFMRHKAEKEIFEIVTRTGKKIKITGDHSLFGLKENQIQPVKCRELCRGSYIAIPRFMALEKPSKQFINLFDYFDKINSGFIVGDELKIFIEKNWLKVKEIAFSLGYSKSSPSAWKRNRLIPVKVFKKIGCSGLNQFELKFKIDKDSKPIPTIIQLNNDFLNFIGLWLADGCYDNKYAVIISSPGCEDPVFGTAKQLGLHTRNHTDKFSLIISNVNLVFFMKEILGLKGNAYSKKFPDWIYNLSRDQISLILKGLFSGDGYTAKYEVGISLVSKKLIEGLEYFLLLFGIVTRKRFVDRDKTFSCRISSLPMLRLFQKYIGFLHETKTKKLNEICAREVTHDTTDIIPFTVEEKQLLSKIIPNFSRQDYITRNSAVGRNKFGKLMYKAETLINEELMKKFSILINSDIFWDEVESIKSLGKINEFVYDFSVPEKESFVCQNIIAHNTLELPVPYMKEIGFNIQRLKTRSPISVSKTETEVAPEEALRTALRLGDSALVIGEVRSLEARTLYEAMRVGAAGNIVIGTIHGDSAYSVWDRVVNDLQVPSTSFKATDIIVVARPIRFGGSLQKHRRVTQITEVKKHWVEDPEREGGLLDLMVFDAKKDKMELLEDNLKDSELFDRIQRNTGMTMNAIWDNIKMNANAKAFLVEAKNKLDLKELLEAENSVAANNKLLLLKEDQLEEHGSVDYNEVLGKWKYWMQNDFLKRLLARKKK